MDDVNFDELQRDLEKAPQVKAFLQQLSRAFLSSSMPTPAIVEAIAILVGDV